jgi:hypothetical protein
MPFRHFHFATLPRHFASIFHFDAAELIPVISLPDFLRLIAFDAAMPAPLRFAADAITPLVAPADTPPAAISHIFLPITPLFTITLFITPTIDIIYAIDLARLSFSRRFSTLLSTFRHAFRRWLLASQLSPIFGAAATTFSLLTPLRHGFFAIDY